MREIHTLILMLDLVGGIGGGKERVVLEIVADKRKIRVVEHD